MSLIFTLTEIFAIGSLIFYGSVFALAKGLKSKPAQNLLQYIHRYLHGLHHMIRSSESSGKAQSDPDLVRDQKDKPTKTIIFFRHGESVWNKVFNRGFGLDFPGRFASAIFQEIFLAPKLDSVFFDTPLSEKGIEQAAQAIKFLQNFQTGKDPKIDRAVNILKGDSDEEVAITVSNLRRAIQTSAVGLSLRLQKGKKDKHLVMSVLQEMSRNVDTQSWLPANQVPRYDLGADNVVNVNAKELYDVKFSKGNKKISSKGADRQKDFAKWAFSQPHEVIIVVGHSLWFKSFFKNFLPQFSLHESKKRKIVNCGIVTFDLQKGSHKGQDLFRIEQSSIKTIYGGFK